MGEYIEDKVILEETTLRDGDQSPSVNFLLEEKLHIATILSDILTEDDSIDAGFPAASYLEFESVKEISKVIAKNYIMGISRMKVEDIDTTYEALKYTPKRRIGLIIPTSPTHRKMKLNVDQGQLIDLAVASVIHAKKYFDEVEVGLEDGTRTEMDFLYRLIEKLIINGVKSVTIADTIGASMPWEYGDIFKKIKNNVPNIDKLKSLGAHCHNDLGLALPNSIEALRNGANKVGCAFNGLGERAGNTATEEILMYLKLKHNYKDNNKAEYNYSRITECSQVVEKYSTIQVQKNKPIVGENCYLHESGIHQDGILKNKETYQLFDPAIVGYKGEIFAFGKHSGRNGLKYKLEQLGFDSSRVDMNLLFQEFKSFAEVKKRVTDEDIVYLVENLA